MLKFILFLIYIFMLIAVIFLERKSPTEALLWVLVLLCIPYFGAIFYLIFGSTMAIKITAFARKKRLKRRSLTDLIMMNRIEFDINTLFCLSNITEELLVVALSTGV